MVFNASVVFLSLLVVFATIGVSTLAFPGQDESIRVVTRLTMNSNSVCAFGVALFYATQIITGTYDIPIPIRAEQLLQWIVIVLLINLVIMCLAIACIHKSRTGSA